MTIVIPYDPGFQSACESAGLTVRIPVHPVKLGDKGTMQYEPEEKKKIEMFPDETVIDWFVWGKNGGLEDNHIHLYWADPVDLSGVLTTILPKNGNKGRPNLATFQLDEWGAQVNAMNESVQAMVSAFRKVVQENRGYFVP